MTIRKTKADGVLTVAVEGRIDTASAPELEKELKENCEGISVLIFDFEKLDYLSSAGLRILLTSEKNMRRQGGKMKVIHVNKMVNEIFEVTGFSDFLTVE